MTRDKDPLDISRDSSFQSRCRERWCVYMSRGWGVSSLHAQAMLFQVYSCFGVCACVCLRLHTLLQPAVDVAHFLACVSVPVYPRRCWLFPQECVCVLIEAISCRVCV